MHHRRVEVVGDGPRHRRSRCRAARRRRSLPVTASSWAKTVSRTRPDRRGREPTPARQRGLGVLAWTNDRRGAHCRAWGSSSTNSDACRGVSFLRSPNKARLKGGRQEGLRCRIVGTLNATKPQLHSRCERKPADNAPLLAPKRGHARTTGGLARRPVTQGKARRSNASRAVRP